ncbi:hypothetical protein [Dactylosporangium sp. NPDC050588]|uniref:hypothetical protein n=1 Tax=Dactylosporangium sp. NPDC050588 TaxID=3157211 RepID=UPI0033E39913
MLGPELVEEIRRERPHALRIVAPPSVLRLPLELGISVPIAYELPDGPSYRAHRPIDRLRILMIAATEPALSHSVRREQQTLTRVVRAAATQHGKAVELRVLQPGLTRDQLRETIEEFPGWDVLHLSAHGRTDGIVLERPGGGPDLVDSESVLQLLRPTSDRLQLVVVSRCHSDRESLAETLDWLGLSGEQTPEEYRGPGWHHGDPIGWAALAHRKLGAAVVTMRYPITAELSNAFVGTFYEGLLGDGNVSIDRALHDAAADAVQHSAIVIGDTTPLLVPDGPAEAEPDLRHLDGFPERPARFTGRTEQVIAAGAALAADSGLPGVLFLGRFGVGKTACAIEVAYQHQDRYQALIWWQAAPGIPGHPAAVALAFALEQGLGLPVVQAASGEPHLRRFLPQLRAVLRDRPVLVVLDNVDALLDDDGQWQEPLLRQLVGALLDHGGQSRVLMTSQTVPADLTRRPLRCRLDPLSAGESALLARELPRLGKLFREDPELSRRVLVRSGGLPKLLELLDAASADTGALSTNLLRIGDEPTTDAPFSAELLADWTRILLEALPQAARLLLQLLAQIEDDDRVETIVRDAWVGLGDEFAPDAPPPFRDALAPLLASRMVEVVEPEEPADELSTLRLPSPLAKLVCTAMPAHVARLVNRVLANYWSEAFERLLHEGHDGDETPEAALRALPYQVRGEQYDEALRLMRSVDQRDRQPAVTFALLGHLARIIARDPEPVVRVPAEALEAQILARREPAQARDRLQHLYQAARAEGLDHVAAAVATDLATVLCERGEFTAAADLVGERNRLVHGVWDQVTTRCLGLHIQGARGELVPALHGAVNLAGRIQRWPLADPSIAGATTPSRATEALLRVAYNAAVSLDRWPLALRLNEAIVASLSRRGASRHERAWVQFNACTPLLRTGDHDGARRLLKECLDIFEQTHDLRALGAAYSAQAEIAALAGDRHDARVLALDALRLTYSGAEPNNVAAGHHNLARYLVADRSPFALASAHRIAAGMLLLATGRHGPLAATVRALAADLRVHGDVDLPGSIDVCVSRVQSADGVRFADLLTLLAPDPDRQTALFADVIAGAKEAGRSGDELHSTPTLPIILGAL